MKEIPLIPKGSYGSIYNKNVTVSAILLNYFSNKKVDEIIKT